jgi:hypothetical protein
MTKLGRLTLAGTSVAFEDVNDMCVVVGMMSALYPSMDVREAKARAAVCVACVVLTELHQSGVLSSEDVGLLAQASGGAVGAEEMRALARFHGDFGDPWNLEQSRALLERMLDGSVRAGDVNAMLDDIACLGLPAPAPAWKGERDRRLARLLG